MKINELLVLEEAELGRITTGRWLVIIDSHSMDQTIDRQVLPTDVDRVIAKIPTVERQIEQIANGQQFWLYDHLLTTGLGMRMINKEQGRLILKTLLDKRPWDGPTPIIDLDRPDQTAL